MLVVLVVIALVAMLGVARQETKTATQVRLKAEAQANAKLALEMALAALQEELGPDQRIAATASIHDNDPDTAEADGIAAPWMCGVWDSWRWQIPGRGIGIQDHEAEKVSRFRRWLISDPVPEKAAEIDFPKTLSFSGETVDLVGRGTLGESMEDDDPGRVRAGLVDVTPDDSGAREKGRLAWICLDENAKARVDLPGDGNGLPGSVGEQAALLAGAPRLGVDTLEDLDGLPVDPEERGRVLTLGTMEMAAGILDEKKGRWFHDLTTWSSGFHANVVDGGLKHDLSLLFSSGRGLPAEYAGGHLIERPRPAVRWEYVRDFANLWRHVDAENGFRIGAIPPQSNPADSPPSLSSAHPVLPVVVRMQVRLFVLRPLPRRLEHVVSRLETPAFLFHGSGGDALEPLQRPARVRGVSPNMLPTSDRLPLPSERDRCAGRMGAFFGTVVSRRREPCRRKCGRAPGEVVQDFDQAGIVRRGHLATR